jgi:hypothetical protein
MTAEESCSYAMVSLDPLVDSGRDQMGTSLAHVPFDFLVGEMLLRAGPYAVAPSELSGMFSVRRCDSESSTVFVQGINLDEGSSTVPNSLLFYCQQNSYFLAQALNGFGWARS